MAAPVEEANKEADSGIDTSLLRELARTSLVDALNSINGAKTLVIEPSFSGPLSLIVEASLLKQHGVDKMFWLERGPLSCNTTNIVLLCRPSISVAKLIAEQVKKHQSEARSHSYTLLLVPRTSTLISRVLEEEGVLGDVQISSYELQLIPLERDVISMEHNASFKQVWMDGDETVIHEAAHALVTFQRIYGVFPKIMGKGDSAFRLADLMLRLLPVHLSAQLPTLPPAASRRIDGLVIIDRRVDMVTPLMTQLTYQGLLDEIIGIKNSHADIPESLLNPPSQPSQPSTTSTVPTTSNSSGRDKETKKKYHLSGDRDSLFREIRDQNFAVIGKHLSRVAHRLDEDYKSKTKNMSVAQLKAFVGRLGGLQSLRIHTALSEQLSAETETEVFNKALEVQQNLLASYDTTSQINTIEDLIAQNAPFELVIRLLCIASIAGNGLKAKALESLKRDVLQTYGYHHLSLLIRLASLHLLLSAPLAQASITHKISLPDLRRSLRLLSDEEPNSEDPEDAGYVYSGYTPISVRLIQCIVHKNGLLPQPQSKDIQERRKQSGVTRGNIRAHPLVGWKGFEEVAESLPGKVFDMTQQIPEAASSRSTLSGLPDPEDVTTVVFFLGGCTYAEMAALRWVQRQSKGRQLLIATTDVLSGSQMVRSLADAPNA